MRRIVLAMMIAGIVQGGAQAADFPDLPVLRGSLRDGLSSRGARWQGFYVGAQYGASTTNFGAPEVSAPLASLASVTSPYAAVSSPNLRPDKNTANGIGGFIGYNAQWDDVVLGIDANYSVGGQRGLADFGPVTQQQSYGGVPVLSTTSGAATMKITDYGALRARAGWAIGSFLPYVTGGVAIGRVDSARTVIVSGIVDYGGANTPYGPITGTQSKNGAFVYGYSYGGGLDIMLARGLFLRGEVEVTRFTANWGMDATVTTGRGGVGYRF